MSEAKSVQTFDGLYDEKAEALTCDVNDRRLCGRWWGRTCAWVNASLHWSAKTDKTGNLWHVGLECFGHEGFRKWGVGYGSIRFCRRCKRIACIHDWADQQVYEIAYSPYYATAAEIATCGRCGLRVLMHGWGACRPKPEALALINIVATELGKPAVTPGGGYGSGWLFEFPVAVSDVLDLDGEAAARAYIRRAFDAGTCEVAFAAIHSSKLT